MRFNLSPSFILLSLLFSSSTNILAFTPPSDDAFDARAVGGAMSLNDELSARGMLKQEVDMELRALIDELSGSYEAREFGDVYERDFDGELYERDFDGELYERDLDGSDDWYSARDIDDDRYSARTFDDDKSTLFLRELNDEIELALRKIELNDRIDKVLRQLELVDAIELAARSTPGSSSNEDATPKAPKARKLLRQTKNLRGSTSSSASEPQLPADVEKFAAEINSELASIPDSEIAPIDANQVTTNLVLFHKSALILKKWVDRLEEAEEQGDKEGIREAERKVQDWRVNTRIYMWAVLANGEKDPERYGRRRGGGKGGKGKGVVGKRAEVVKKAEEMRKEEEGAKGKAKKTPPVKKDAVPPPQKQKPAPAPSKEAPSAKKDA
ncbi:hypothetical protein CC1G_02577 [Coprinopsis cinerea okayama7|uniref:Uncharacterized protein n=1 Tax=Coprinopsis cinerea (strain Okayama-7 / 130 / ATCC MYA-4618 / FGSC 9003) TaxID=240176 RepID=A8PB75_COPC7|nr:hypothetical protein CC1G_02577 [Coprinopsis cinerea okayama7\|eukprot:XP_001840114.1 hypothetical protein CC1G_02577 [Coprinopsis cinerea okayama7\